MVGAGEVGTSDVMAGRSNLNISMGHRVSAPTAWSSTSDMPDSCLSVATTSDVALSSALDAIDRAPSALARLRAVVDVLHRWGFGRVMAVLRDPNLSPITTATAGATDADSAPDALQALPGVIWRQRLPLLTAYAEGGWFRLPGDDPWVAREFWASAPVERSHEEDWNELDLIIAVISGSDGETLGTVMLSDASRDRRPDQRCAVETMALLRHLGGRLSYDTLKVLAQRRAERLQRLQEAGAAMARSLDEGEIVRELARQVTRATNPDGVVVASPDLGAHTCRTLVRFVGTTERPAGAVRALTDGIIAEVARNGRAIRSGTTNGLNERSTGEPWSPLEALDVMGETVGEFGPPASVLAVPVMAGIRLLGVLAVHASTSGRFTAEDEEVVTIMASQAATALANARRYAESERERRQTEALADVARAVGESLRPGEVLHLILRHAVALLQAQGACIALRQDEWLHIVAGTGAADLLAGVHVPLEGSLLGRVTITGGHVCSNSLPLEDGAYIPLQRIAPIHNTVIAPLTTARGIIGAIAVINRSAPFTEDDVRILQRLGDQVSVAIVNARLFDEVERATREWKVAFDSVATGLAVLDESRRVRRCNRHFADLCGRADITELIGADFQRLLLGDTAVSAEDDVIARASREGTVARGEVRNARRGLVFHLTAGPHPDGGTMVTIDDITDARRLAERYQRVVETALDAIVITDTERRIAFANPAAHALLAHPGSLIGVAVRDLVAPESESEVTHHETLALHGLSQRYECFVVRADGSHRRVEVSTAPLHEVGSITGTVACLRDITSERDGVSALQQSEARYTRLVEEATDAIFTIDTNGCFTSVNRSLEEASGVPRDHLLGKRCVGIVDPRDRALGDETIRRTLNGERLQITVRYTAANGRIKKGSLISAPVFENGAIVGGLGIMREVGEEQLGATDPDDLTQLFPAPLHD